MAYIYNPEREELKLSQVIEKFQPKTVCLIFIHGLGDLIMFLNPLEALRQRYPSINFRLGLQKGLSFEDIVPDADFEICGHLDQLEQQPYDLVALIHFPMSEGQTQYTKGEWCCIHEIGIDPVGGHKLFSPIKSRLVGLHFQITCLPGMANTPPEVAEKIWNEVKEAGYIPIETLVPHVFHNPINEKYPFIDRHLRNNKPSIRNLINVIQSCEYMICCVSGNFHLAMSLLHPEKVCLLEKDFKAECFTKYPIKRINVNDYQEGSIRNWLGILT